MGYPDRNTFQGRAVADATDAQIITVPWKARRRYIPMRMIVTNENAAASLVKMYDKDSAVGAPPTRGDNGVNALFEFYIPAQSTIVLGTTDIPIEFFHAGVTVNCTKSPCHFMIEMQED